MYKLGNRLAWNWQPPGSSGSVTFRFRQLVSTVNIISQEGNWSTSSHPDGGGVLNQQVLQDQNAPFAGREVPGGGGPFQVTSTQWETGSTYRPGPLDLNFAYDDGSARLMDRVTVGSDTANPYDQRVVPVPQYMDGAGWPGTWNQNWKP